METFKSDSCDAPWGEMRARNGRKTRRQGAYENWPNESCKNELYLVEGTLPTAKQGRDRKFKLSCLFRGKVINSTKAMMADILKNEEINTMIYTIGAGDGADFSLEVPTMTKIIIMTDADTDNCYIQTLS